MYFIIRERERLSRPAAQGHDKDKEAVSEDKRRNYFTIKGMVSKGVPRVSVGAIIFDFITIGAATNLIGCGSSS